MESIEVTKLKHHVNFMRSIMIIFKSGTDMYMYISIIIVRRFTYACAITQYKNNMLFKDRYLTNFFFYYVVRFSPKGEDDALSLDMAVGTNLYTGVDLSEVDNPATTTTSKQGI